MHDTVRFGISTPVVMFPPGIRPEWEREAGIEEVVAVAQTADRLGYRHLTVGDHIAVPGGLTRGARFWDGVATFSYLAALTTRIGFLTNVIPLPLYHPLEIAKRYGMVDMLSAGRLVLGLGAGNLEVEFAALGRSFDDRGPRTDDALRALRAAIDGHVVSYAGTHYDFHDLVIDPNAVQPHVPFWIGGHTRRALRRAIELGDGWIPPPTAFNGLAPEDVASALRQHVVPEDFVVLLTTDALDPISAPDAALAHVDHLVACGANGVNVRFAHQSLHHYLEQLEAFAHLVELTGES